MPPNILEVRNLVTRFYTTDGVINAVNDVSFQLAEGETLAIVGESGCGKSVTVLSLLRLIPDPPGKIESGEAMFKGRDLLKLSEREMRKVRGSQVGIVFQDPMTSLNPMIRIGDQIAEMILEHKRIGREEARERVISLLNLVGIPDAKNRLDDYPHQFSGGMRQRAMIAMALACNPSLLIADEPTTALDVTVQAQIVEQVLALREQLGMTVIWITHDLGVVARLANRVIVMYGGTIVESSDVLDLYKNPRHPYTIGLLGALPRLDKNSSRRLANIEGQPPDLLDRPQLCPFLPRCNYAIDRCYEAMPVLRQVGERHQVSCWVDIDVNTSARMVAENE